MRLPSLPPPLEASLTKALEVLIRRFSKIMASSLRGVAQVIPPDARPWSPKVRVTREGCLEAEGRVFCFKQVKADVTGGRGRDDGGRPFRVKGGNSLERVRVYGLATPRGTRIMVFVLEFGDEEHPLPLVDTLYRMLRLLIFARTRDVEAFLAVLPKSKSRSPLVLVFPYICSRGKTYASRLGAHYTCVEWVRGARVDIYVSNVWNHAMSTRNTNPSLDVVLARPKYIVERQHYVE